MPKNPSPSLLDAGQIVKRVYDEANDAVRVEVAAGTDFEISIDAADGDSAMFVGTEDGTPTGTQHTVKINSLGNTQVLDMGKLVPKEFDTILATYPLATTEVYTYKTGGSGGTTVATVTVTYTDASKAVFVSAERS